MYSQYGQDKFLEENYFKDIYNGYFVDVGAYDGKTLSNTLFFEEKGWDGICIEPLPDVFKELEKNRKCSLYNVAIAKESGEEEFLNIKSGPRMLSGLSKNLTGPDLHRINYEVNLERGSFETIKVKTQDFNWIVSKPNINYLSLDTEGSELEILESIDWSFYQIDFMTVENNHHKPNLENFLRSKGYFLLKKFDVDYLFRRN